MVLFRSMLIVATILVLAYTEFGTCSLYILACAFVGCTCPGFAFAYTLYQIKQLGGAITVHFGTSTGFRLKDPSTFFHQFFRQSICGRSGSVQLFHMTSCKCILPQLTLNASSVCDRVHRGGWSTKHLKIFLLHNSFLASVMLPQ